MRVPDTGRNRLPDRARVRAASHRGPPGGVPVSMLPVTVRCGHSGARPRALPDMSERVSAAIQYVVNRRCRLPASAVRLGIAAVLALGAVLASPQSRASPYGPEYDAAFERMLANPADLDLSFRFAILARRAGDLEGAVGVLERMLVYNPELPVVRYELARLYAMLGSIEAAKLYYRSALRYAPPPEIRGLIENALADLERASQPSSLFGTVLLGFRHQTNANAAPDDPAVRIGGVKATLADEFLETDDTSTLVSAQLTHRYDLGRDPAVFVVSELQLYGSRQADLKSNDIDLVAATVGPGFSLSGGVMLRPFLRGDWVALDGNALYRSLGGGLAIRNTPASKPRWNYFAEAAILFRDFRESLRSPTVDNRDGENIRIGGTLRRAVSETLRVDGFGNLELQRSKAGFESYSAAKMGVRAVKQVPAPVGNGAWRLSVTGEAGIRDYESPDRTIDPDESRRDLDYTLAVGLTVPLSQAMSLTMDIRQQWRRASLPNYEFDNQSVLTGLSFAF